jgi:hypothetical protein
VVLRFSGVAQATSPPGRWRALSLHVVALTRMRHDPRTRRFVERRTAEGLSRKDVLRCLKRYIAREIYYLLRPATRPPIHIAA